MMKRDPYPIFPLTPQGAIDMSLHSVVEGVGACIHIGLLDRETATQVIAMICDALKSTAGRHCVNSKPTL